MAGAFSRSFQLVKESFNVLKQDKEIMLFPIISTVLVVLVFVSFIIPVYFLGVKTGSMPNYLFYVLFFAFYLVSYFIIIFFNTGLITCAHIRLNGKNPTFKDGIRNAKKHIGKIFVWALISATVCIVLRAIADRSRLLGRIVVGIIGIAWSLLTFFIIPVLIFEDKSIKESIKRSASLFKKTWGENIIGQFSIGLFFVILAVVGIVIPIILSFYATSSITFILIIGIMVLYWVILGIISSSLNGVFVVALYQYAVTGKVPSVYSPEVIRNAFKEKSSSDKKF